MKPKLLNKHMWKYVDWFLVAVICLLVGFGLLSMINATADPFTGDEQGIAGTLANLDLSFALRQVLFFAIGCVAIFFIMLVDYTVIQKITEYIYWGCILFLVLVLIFGSTNKGATGWFMVGSFGLQPAEFAKIGVILALAKVLAIKTEGHEEGITKFRDIIPALWRFLLPFGLIAAQPDFGTAVVYAVIFIMMLFMAKTHWKIILILFAIALVALLLVWNLDFFQAYQQTRLKAFFDPASQSSDSLMQVNQAKMAIGSGGIFGKGLFSPGALSQLGYVPETHNDFIFAATVETFGMVGGLVVLLLYFVLIGRTIMLAMRAKDDFGAYIIIGVAAMTLFHVVENIGMNVGAFPVTGIPLPFFSYGGSNMLTNMIAYGIVLSVDMRRTRWPIG